MPDNDQHASGHTDMWHLTHMRKKNPRCDHSCDPNLAHNDLATLLDQRANEENQRAIREQFFKGKLSGKCVEIGCGSGAVARHLFEMNRDDVSEFLAVDPNAELVDYAGRKARGEEDIAERKLKFDVGWLGKLGAEIDVKNVLEERKYEEHFDHVLLITTLSHIDTKNFPAVLEQARALLKPGTGIIHVFDNDLANRGVVGKKGDLVVSGYNTWISTVYSEYSAKKEFFFGERKTVSKEESSTKEFPENGATSKLMAVLKAAGFGEIGETQRAQTEYTSRESFGWNNLMLACAKYGEICADKNPGGRDQGEKMRKLAEDKVDNGDLRMIFGYGYVWAKNSA